MGPTWGRQDPCGPHVGPMNHAIWDVVCLIEISPWTKLSISIKCLFSRYNTHLFIAFSLRGIWVERLKYDSQHWIESNRTGVMEQWSSDQENSRQYGISVMCYYNVMDILVMPCVRMNCYKLLCGTVWKIVRRESSTSSINCQKLSVRWHRWVKPPQVIILD